MNLKFRAWDKANNRWLYGYETVGGFSMKGECILLGEYGNGPLEWFLQDVVIDMWTGLQDKNKKDIYLNDIVRCSKYIGGNFVEWQHEIGYVDFVHGAFGLHRKEGFYRPFKDWLEDWEYEVLGNLHEHRQFLI